MDNLVQAMVNEFWDVFEPEEKDAATMQRLGVFAVGYAAGYRTAQAAALEAERAAIELKIGGRE